MSGSLSSSTAVVSAEWRRVMAVKLDGVLEHDAGRVVGLTPALAEELRAAKVFVNAICPGSVDTDMLRQGMPHARPDMTADDIAKTAVFLAHAAPQALTGACIDVYG